MNHYKCPRCQQKAMLEGACGACGYYGAVLEDLDQLLKYIGSYDIVIDDPKKHVPYGMFCTTFEAYEFQALLQKRIPSIKWQVMLFEEWVKLYEGDED